MSKVLRFALGGAVLGAVIGGLLGRGIAKRLNKPAVFTAGISKPKVDTNQMFQLGLAIFGVIRQLVEMGR
ncbi:MAG: hypothetical protein ACYCZF_17695 [Anaerolineae bacterium]